MEATKDNIPLQQNLNTKKVVLETIFIKLKNQSFTFRFMICFFQIKETSRLETFKLKHISTFYKVQLNVKNKL